MDRQLHIHCNIIDDSGFRLDGTLEIKDEGRRRGMEDMIVATLSAMLEWRKHNNKVTQLLL